MSGLTKAELEKPFPITSLCRKDLVDAGIPREIVESLDDEAMAVIAARMEDDYVILSFWDSAKYHVERYLRESLIPRIAPVSPQLILSYLAERVLDLPKSY